MEPDVEAVEVAGDGSLEASAEEEARRTTKERLAAADSLRRWIDEEQPENKAILERLETDIRADVRLNEWGAFALEDLLRPPLVNLREISWFRWASRITLIRNIALFVPVLLTWTAIERAASAYANAGSAKTFLKVWQDDVEPLPPPFSLLGSLTLGHVALLDAIVIGLLIILTVVAHMFESHAEVAAENLDREKDKQFREVMVDVGLFLHGFRQITPAALKGGLADAVNQLVVATTAIRDATEGLENVSQSAATTLEEFAKMSAREFAPAAERLAVMVKTLEDTTVAHERMSELVAALQSKLADTLASMESNVTNMTDSVVSKLEETVRQTEVAFANTVLVLERLGTNLQGAASSTSAAIEAIAVRRRDLEG